LLMGFELFSFFKGGVHPPGNKHFTEDKPIEKAKVPALVYIPLQQHIGAPCEPTVKPGDQVKMGQVIGQQKGHVCAPIHSSVSGKVKSIIPFATAHGSKVQTIVIENDGLDTPAESIIGRNVDEVSAQEILDTVLNAGIVGLGNATFPTHVKLSPPADKVIEAVILNGAECEPYLTADHRLMVEEPDAVVGGLRLIMRVLDVETGYIGIEDNKPDAIAAIEKAIGDYPNITIKTLKTKYPQGCERNLIETITGRQVPSGGLPMDVGIIVNNVTTAAQIYKSVSTGMPLIERTVTITGRGINNPRNLLVKFGTLVSDVIEECGGLSCEPGKIIIGGPMMGVAQHTMDIPITKGVSGIVFMPRDEVKEEEILPCIRCAKCIQVCPIRLMPLSISAHSLRGEYDTCETLHALDCVECGACSYICPSKRPLQESIKLAKQVIIDRRRNEN
jgi:electron transport complex protein RnfC